MPKATVYKDQLSLVAEHQIWLAKKLTVQPIMKAHSTYNFPDFKLWNRVLAVDSPHILCSLSGR